MRGIKRIIRRVKKVRRMQRKATYAYNKGVSLYLKYLLCSGILYTVIKFAKVFAAKVGIII